MTLRRGIRRTRRLLDQLLALARAQNETGEAQPTPLIPVIRTVLEDLMPLAEAKGLDLELVTQQDVVVRASEIDLTMLVRNLVDNAIRYTPEGGRIDLSVESGPDGTAFRVQDTGPGIRPEERERVFDPFHRLLGNDEFGSGLGLSIVKTIADRLGAGISLGQVRRSRSSSHRYHTEEPDLLQHLYSALRDRAERDLLSTSDRKRGLEAFWRARVPCRFPPIPRGPIVSAAIAPIWAVKRSRDPLRPCAGAQASSPRDQMPRMLNGRLCRLRLRTPSPMPSPTNKSGWKTIVRSRRSHSQRPKAPTMRTSGL